MVGNLKLIFCSIIPVLSTTQYDEILVQTWLHTADKEIIFFFFFFLKVEKVDFVAYILN